MHYRSANFKKCPTIYKPLQLPSQVKISIAIMVELPRRAVSNVADVSAHNSSGIKRVVLSKPVRPNK